MFPKFVEAIQRSGIPSKRLEWIIGRGTQAAIFYESINIGTWYRSGRPTVMQRIGALLRKLIRGNDPPMHVCGLPAWISVDPKLRWAALLIERKTRKLVSRIEVDPLPGFD